MDNVTFILMAGGRGERLRPLTDSCPKPLLRFGPSGRIIDFTLRNCLASGAERVVVLTQYLSELLAAYLARQWQPVFSRNGSRFEVIPGQTTPGGSFLGTADSVYRFLELTRRPPEYLVVLAGDHVYSMDYRPMIRFHQAHGGVATVAAVPCPRDQAHQFGIIQHNGSGRIEKFVEKPEGNLTEIAPSGQDPLASMGIYVFTTAELFRYLRKTRENGLHDFGHHVLPIMAGDRKAWAYRFLTPDGKAGYWRDVGDVSSYRRTLSELISSPARFPSLTLPGYPPSAGMVAYRPGWKQTGGRLRLSELTMSEFAVTPELDPWRTAPGIDAKNR